MTVRPRVLAALALVAAAASADGQQFGQWSWDASLGGVLRSYEDTAGGVDVLRQQEESEAAVGVGVNGFLVHPAIASFRAGVLGLFGRYGSSVKTSEIGFDTRLRVLPQSVLPVDVFASRAAYDYTLGSSNDQALVDGTPDTSTSWGGRMRIRRGPLGGALLGIDSTTIDLVGGGDAQAFRRAFVDWSRATGTIQHHVNVERTYQDLGQTGYAYDDTTLGVTEHGQLPAQWQWNLSGSAIRRSYVYRGTGGQTSDAMRLANQFTRRTAAGRALSLDYSGGLSRGGSGFAYSSHRLGARYSRNLPASGTVTPFAAYGVQASDGATVGTREAGIAAAWTRAAEKYSVGVNGTVSHIGTESTDSGRSYAATILGYSAGVNAATTGSGPTRAQLEASYTSSDVTTAGETAGDFPDLGASLYGSGFSDNAAAKLTLTRRLDPSRVSAWAEYRLTRTNPIRSASIDLATMTASVQITSPLGSLTASGGSTRVTGAKDESIEFLAAAGSVSLWRSLRMNASWRADVRQLTAAPDRDSRRLELGADYRIGMLIVGAAWFDGRYLEAGGRTIRNRGLTATIRRNFSGTLPIVSAPERRGVVR